MNNKLEWTELLGNSFLISKIDNLEPRAGNIHICNAKVLYTTIIKNAQSSYKYKIGIQHFPLGKNKHYTLCIEISNADYQLWHKSVVTVDKSSS